jgi:GntR family transcriptional regulator/MocR family aminotransferase
VLDLAFQPDRRSPVPMHRQLADALRELIASGRLPAGEKLPASRELATTLCIARNTATRAYQALVEDGALVAHVGQGTFVGSRAAARRAEEEAQGQRPFAWDTLLSQVGRTPLPPGLLAPAPGPVRVDFEGGRVAAGALPFAALKRAWSRAISQTLPYVANDRDPLGYAPLRRAVATRLVARGIGCEADDVLITAGAQQALELVGRVLVDPGDAVAVEQPGYFGATMVFAAAGARLTGIEVDEEGLRTDTLARALRSQRIKLVYTTPAAQMPTGAVLSETRRQALLELADATQTPVLEDDYDSEFRFGDAPLPALKTRDPAGQVIYVGTFSKALFPGLRLGYVVAARPLLGRLALARLRASMGPELLSQIAVADLLDSGALERHLRGVRRHYAERREALLGALEAHLPAGFRWSRPAGGLGVWLALPDGLDADALRRAARERGIAITAGGPFFSDGRGAGHISLSFASETPAALTEGVEQLASIARRLGARRRRKKA